MASLSPRGWSPGKTLHRFQSASPSSYNSATHSAECVISTGAPVQRIYGREILSITREAVDLSRIPVPLLDSHSQGSIADVLGRIDRAWIANGQLLGKITFAQTPRGKMAEGMVARGEISGISAGYAVSKWSAVDSDGDAVDPGRAGWDDDLTFTATRWQVLEASLCGVPADALSVIRSLKGVPDHIINARARMFARSRMARLQGQVR